MNEQKSFSERYGKKSSFTSTNPFQNSSYQEYNSQNTNSQNADINNIIDQSPRKAVDPQKRALAQYIYLVKGVDAGRNAWYYVLVERLKVQLFLKALNDDIIHLEKYGKILYSAYGDEPPANITQLVKDEYGIE
ncbi:MAG: hypothetical protein EBT63_04475 [Proteobacteria bacterium]|jgi:hypothetical protein|nr:hypothetical protein [Pseudomonadota bacterium]NCA28062.1 hypothetical protein [Pseudomonadota bacterium]